MSRWKFVCLHIPLFCLFILVFLLLSLEKIHCFDIWWHLATGKWIWTHKAIPSQDVFSFTQKGHPWIDFTWGFQALIYPIYKVSGLSGIILFKTLILFLAFYFLYKTLNLLTRNSLLIWFLMFSVLLASYPRFMVRPHIFTFLFISLFIYLLTLYQKMFKKRYLILLAIFFLFWVNLHGSFILGIFLVFAYLAGEVFLRYNWQAKEILRLPTIKGLCILLFGLFILSFINPYGIELIKFVISSHQGEGMEAIQHIAEWKRFPWKAIFVFNFNRGLFFKLIFWLGIISIFLSRFLAIREVLIFILFSYLTFKHARFAGCFSFAIAPAIACLMPNFKRDNFIYALFLLLIFIFICKLTIFNPYFKKNLGLGIDRGSYPIETTAFLKRHDLKGNLFNTYGWGGYLIWQLYPKYKVFIDGRTPTIYPPEFYWQYRVAEDGNLIAFKKLIQRYNINLVLTKSKRFARLLKKEDSWALIGFDGRGYLFAKKNGLPNKIKVFKYYDPTEDIDKLISQYREEGKLSLLKSDLESAERTFKDVALIYNSLGILYADGEKDYKKAIFYFKKSLKSNPYDPKNYYNLGLGYKNAKRWEEAIRYFKKALYLNKSYPQAYYHLALAYYQKKEYKKTEKYLQKYCKLVGDRAMPTAYEYLGLSYYKNLRLEKAIKYFRRAVLIAKDREEEKKNYYNLGNCYFGLGMYEKAIEYYRKSLKIDPKFEKAKYNLKKAREKVCHKQRD